MSSCKVRIRCLFRSLCAAGLPHAIPLHTVNSRRPVIEGSSVLFRSDNCSKLATHETCSPQSFSAAKTDTASQRKPSVDHRASARRPGTDLLKRPNRCQGCLGGGRPTWADSTSELSSSSTGVTYLGLRPLLGLSGRSWKLGFSPISSDGALLNSML